MKIKSSLKSLKKRDLNSKLVKRRGRVYIINKVNPKFKARQKWCLNKIKRNMIIGSVSENKSVEKRIAITPDILKRYKSLGIEIRLVKDYGAHLGISDKEYESEGASIINREEDIILSSDAILQMNIPNDENLNMLKKDQILVGVLNPYTNEKKLKEIIKKKY